MQLKILLLFTNYIGYSMIECHWWEMFSVACLVNSCFEFLVYFYGISGYQWISVIRKTYLMVSQLFVVGVYFYGVKVRFDESKWWITNANKILHFWIRIY